MDQRPQKAKEGRGGSAGQAAHPVSKGAPQSMLPTEDTGKRKPEEEDGRRRQKKEQEGDCFLHRHLGGKQQWEMKEGRGFPMNRSPSLAHSRCTDPSTHPEEQHPQQVWASTGLRPLCSLVSVDSHCSPLPHEVHADPTAQKAKTKISMSHLPVGQASGHSMGQGWQLGAINAQGRKLKPQMHRLSSEGPWSVMRRHTQHTLPEQQ